MRFMALGVCVMFNRPVRYYDDIKYHDNFCNITARFFFACYRNNCHRNIMC